MLYEITWVKGSRGTGGKAAEMMDNTGRTGFGDLIAVDRALGELRRGLPVILTHDGRHFTILAGEGIDGDTLDRVRKGRTGPVRLILSHPRARTLKIRIYTPGVVSVAGAETLSPEIIRALVDPCLDLATPLKGPFDAERVPEAHPAWVSGVRLAKLAQLLPAVLVTEIAGPGTFPDLLCVSTHAVDDYERADADSLTPVVTARVPLADAPNSKLVAFRPADGGPEHLAIIIGTPPLDAPVLTRLHSECFTGDLLGSLKCDCGEQLRGAIAAMEHAGAGILLYLAQEGRGIGLINKLRAYQLQDQGFDTVEANERLGFDADERLFRPAARMLEALGHKSVRLMTNNPDKVQALEAYGIKVVERVAHKFPSNPHNEFYLSVKRSKSGHLL